MADTEPFTTVKVKLPTDVYDALEAWASSEVQSTAADVLELLANQVLRNRELREMVESFTVWDGE